MDLDSAIRIIRSSPEITKALYVVLDTYIERNLNTTVENKDSWEVARGQGSVKVLRTIKDRLNQTGRKS